MLTNNNLIWFIKLSEKEVYFFFLLLCNGIIPPLYYDKKLRVMMFTVLWKREFEIQKKKIVRKNVLCDSICFLESKSYISYFWSPALSSKGDRKLLSVQKYASKLAHVDILHVYV